MVKNTGMIIFCLAIDCIKQTYFQQKILFKNRSTFAINYTNNYENHASIDHNNFHIAYIIRLYVVRIKQEGRKAEI